MYRKRRSLENNKNEATVVDNNKKVFFVSTITRSIYFLLPVVITKMRRLAIFLTIFTLLNCKSKTENADQKYIYEFKQWESNAALEFIQTTDSIFGSYYGSNSGLTEPKIYYKSEFSSPITPSEKGKGKHIEFILTK